MNRYLPFHSLLRKTAFRLTAIFVLLFIVTVPFPRALLPDPGRFTAPFFEAFARWSAVHLFHVQPPYSTRLLSDTTGLYIHVFHLLLLSVVASAAWSIADKGRKLDRFLHRWFPVIVRYYLAAQLLTYGWNKVFKWQFYQPEPNTLFTAIGETSKDLLYWSTMGSSRLYSAGAGLLEVFAGALLFFRRTTLIGSLIALALLGNVVLVNFSFDISVKIFSLFLLLLCLILVVLQRRQLYPLWSRPYTPAVPEPSGSRPPDRRLVTAKWLCMAYIAADSMAPYFRTGNFNDDTAPRPALHGAYEVQDFRRNGILLPPLTTDTIRWRRVFVHRRGYLIIQAMNGAVTDYRLEYDTVRRQLFIQKPEEPETVWNYRELPDGMLHISGIWHGDSLSVALEKVDLQKLPLLQHGFHWTSDW